VCAFLFGDGPKLPTVAQSAQLLWGTALGLLFFSTLQLRYEWLGARSAGGGSAIRGDESSMEWVRSLSMIAVVSASVCFGGMAIARALFLVTNRSREGATRGEVWMIFGSAWSIVLLCCFAMAVGTTNMGANMDVRILNEYVMVSWGLAAGMQWIVVEPIMLLLLSAIALLLKWCTSFDDAASSKQKGKAAPEGVEPTDKAAEEASARDGHRSRPLPDAGSCSGSDDDDAAARAIVLASGERPVRTIGPIQKRAGEHTEIGVRHVQEEPKAKTKVVRVAYVRENSPLRGLVSETDEIVEINGTRVTGDAKAASRAIKKATSLELKVKPSTGGTSQTATFEETEPEMKKDKSIEGPTASGREGGARRSRPSPGMGSGSESD